MDEQDWRSIEWDFLWRLWQMCMCVCMLPALRRLGSIQGRGDVLCKSGVARGDGFLWSSLWYCKSSMGPVKLQQAVTTCWAEADNCVFNPSASSAASLLALHGEGLRAQKSAARWEFFIPFEWLFFLQRWVPTLKTMSAEPAPYSIWSWISFHTDPHYLLTYLRFSLSFSFSP